MNGVVVQGKAVMIDDYGLYFYKFKFYFISQIFFNDNLEKYVKVHYGCIRGS